MCGVSVLFSGKFTHLESSLTTDSVTRRSDTQKYAKIFFLSILPETVRTCFSTIVAGRATHIWRNDAYPAGRLSIHPMSNNVRLLENRSAGTNQVSRHSGEAGKGAKRIDPARDAAQTAARPGAVTHPGRFRSGRLLASGSCDPSRVSADPSSSVRLIRVRERTYLWTSTLKKLLRASEAIYMWRINKKNVKPIELLEKSKENYN